MKIIIDYLDSGKLQKIEKYISQKNWKVRPNSIYEILSGTVEKNLVKNLTIEIRFSPDPDVRKKRVSDLADFLIKNNLY